MVWDHLWTQYSLLTYTCINWWLGCLGEWFHSSQQYISHGISRSPASFWRQTEHTVRNVENYMYPHYWFFQEEIITHGVTCKPNFSVHRAMFQIKFIELNINILINKVMVIALRFEPKPVLPLRKVQNIRPITINPNSLDNKGRLRNLKDFYCSVTMLRELGLICIYTTGPLGW